MKKIIKIISLISLVNLLFAPEFVSANITSMTIKQEAFVLTIGGSEETLGLQIFGEPGDTGFVEIREVNQASGLNNEIKLETTPSIDPSTGNYARISFTIPEGYDFAYIPDYKARVVKLKDNLTIVKNPGDKVDVGSIKLYAEDSNGYQATSVFGLQAELSTIPTPPGPTAGGPCQTTADCKSGEICDFSTSTCIAVGASSPVTTVSGVDSLIRSVVRWIAILISIIAVIFIILGGVSYLTAGGDAEKAKGAKNKIIYGLIGLAVAALAWGAEALVRSVLKLGQ